MKDEEGVNKLMRDALVSARNELYPEESPTLNTLEQLWDIIGSQAGMQTRGDISKITIRNKISKDFIKALKSETMGQTKI
ncbi:hypothetical protein N9A38_02865 [Gammaproteobacteria bacterium]|jgi:hypothetical protein|nr:hypothetical protein [Gammaproteobacteria bacterium]